MRSELSKKNPYWIPRERYLELKHFTKGYWDYMTELRALYGLKSCTVIDLSREKRYLSGGVKPGIIYWREKLDCIEKAANEACKELAPYVLQVIIESSSYDKLNARYNIPCGRRQFYRAYRRYFWYLDKMLKGNLLTQEA